MLQHISGDITTLSGSFIICQQVNCKGVMGAGVALAIRKRYPQVYSDYMAFCRQHPVPSTRLGHVQTSTVGRNQFICNIFGQLHYGRRGHYTSEPALLTALSVIFAHATKAGLPVFVPSRIGSGLAGGDYNVISSGIDKLASQTGANVYMVDYAPHAIRL